MNTTKIIVSLDGASSPSAFGMTGWVSLVTALIAVLALVLAYRSALLQHRHFRLSSKPLLDIEVGCIDEVLGVSNEGFGPAIIESFTATTDKGLVIDLLKVAGLYQFVDDLTLGIPEIGQIRLRGLMKRTVLGPGARVKIVYSEAELDPELRPVIAANFGRMRLNLAYTCIYDEVHNLEHKGFDG